MIGDKLSKQSETEEEATSENTSLNNSNENESDHVTNGDKSKLKKEIISLNEEIKALLKRIKNTEEGDLNISNLNNDSLIF